MILSCLGLSHISSWHEDHQHWLPWKIVRRENRRMNVYIFLNGDHYFLWKKSPEAWLNETASSYDHHVVLSMFLHVVNTCCSWCSSPLVCPPHVAKWRGDESFITIYDLKTWSPFFIPILKRRHSNRKTGLLIIIIMILLWIHVKNLERKMMMTVRISCWEDGMCWWSPLRIFLRVDLARDSPLHFNRNK